MIVHGDFNKISIVKKNSIGQSAAKHLNSVN